MCSFVLNACSSGDDPILPEVEDSDQPSQAVKVVTLNADNILSGNAQSRTSFTLETDKLKFAWAEGDKVGVWPTDGSSSQVEFSIVSGAGQNTAKFDGGAWALREEVQYAAYYPFNLTNEGSSNSSIRFSYEGQGQTGNASLDHLGSHDLMATNATSAVEGALNFSFKHLNSVAQIRLTVPVSANFTMLTLRCSEKIFAKVANLDLSGSEYVYSIEETTNQLQLALTNVASTDKDKQLVCYMMLPPIDMAGKTVEVVLQSDDNKIYQGQLEPKTLKAGFAYSFAATLVDVTVSSQITSPSFGESDTEV